MITASLCRIIKSQIQYLSPTVMRRSTKLHPNIPYQMQALDRAVALYDHVFFFSSHSLHCIFLFFFRVFFLFVLFIFCYFACWNAAQIEIRIGFELASSFHFYMTKNVARICQDKNFTWIFRKYTTESEKKKIKTNNTRSDWITLKKLSFSDWCWLLFKLYCLRSTYFNSHANANIHCNKENKIPACTFQVKKKKNNKVKKKKFES